MKKQYTGSGYITKNYFVSKKTYNFFCSLTDRIEFTGETPEETNANRNKYHRFLSHLYASTVTLKLDSDKQELKNKGYIPIFSRLIEKEFGREFDAYVLRDLKLIEIKPHVTGKSREYRLKQTIFRKAFKIEASYAKEAWNEMVKDGQLKTWVRVNLMTGRYYDTRKRHKLLTDDGLTLSTNIPKVVKESIKSLTPCPFNPKHSGEYINALEKKYIRERRKFKGIKKTSSRYKQARKEYLTAQGRYHNDRLSQITILNQFPIPIEEKTTKGDRLFQYQAAYKIQNSGRVTEIGGGFQGVSRVVKHLLLKDIKNIYNYDLKSSQANILLQELHYAKIKCRWLENYLNDPELKNKYAKRVGIDVDTWKTCFYALIMGAESKSANKHKAVYKNILGYFKNDKPQAKKPFKKFLKITKKLTRATRKWRDYLYNTKDRRYHYQHKNVKYWKNPCGMKFKQYGIIENQKREDVLIDMKSGETANKRKTAGVKRKLAAFMLQGLESKFIHHLTILCDQNNIPVYKNEHDGLITGKSIPKSLITRASKRSGLKNPILDIKPLCSKSKVNEMKTYVKKNLKKNHQGSRIT